MDLFQMPETDDLACVSSSDYSIHHMQLPLIPAGTGSATGQTTHLLIAHMRYMGKPEDFEKDMSKVGEDPETQRWWKVSSDLERSVPLGFGRYRVIDENEACFVIGPS
jgi:hypothetical protein